MSIETFLTGPLATLLIALVSGGIGGIVTQFWAPAVSQKRQHKLDVQLEQAKSRAQRREFLLTREIAAYDAYVVFYEASNPKPIGYADDPEDGMEQIADNSTKIEKKLEAYAMAHSTAISEELRLKIRDMRDLLHSISRMYVPNEKGDYVAGEEALETADKARRLMREAYNLVLKSASDVKRSDDDI